ncbi:translocation/assembly module TamB, partial [Vicingaceae bacterium]|nr:translocation/assembly module TamB [Vicingaceae bacterium]
YNDKIDSIVIENVLINSKQKGGNKIVTVKSDMLDATVNGAFKFTEVANYIDDFMNRYISVKNEKNDEMASLPNDIDFEIDLYNTELLSKLLLKGVKLSDNSVLSGNYSSKDNKLSVTAGLETIDVYGTEIRKFEFKGEANDNTLSLIVEADKIFNNDSLYIDNFNITSVAGYDSAITNVVWVNDLISSKNEGDITLITNFNSDYNVSNKIVDSYVYISDSLWSINPMNEIVIDTGYFAINDFRIYSVTQSIIIDGELSNDPAQQLNLLMKDVSLLTFKRMIPEKVVSLEGIVNGSAAIKKQNEVMVFTSNLAFNNFEINNYLVGDGILQSGWNSVGESLELDGKFYWEQTPTISFGGFYYPMKEDESLDLNLELYRTELSMFDNYTKEFLDDFNGVADANVALTGTIKKPSLNGSLTLRNTDFTVKYLNTHYRTEFCKINIAPDMINFDNVEFYDDEKNLALANGTVYHEWFSDWSIGVGLDANKFLALNTTEKDNNLYFGKAFVTGYVDIGSYEKLLTIDVKVKTEKNTTLNIPLTDNVDLVENNFIEFISKDSNKVKVDEEVDLSNIEMNFDLEITPEAKVRLVFDDQIGDVMRSTGSGNLNLQITKDGDLDMYGNYVIKDGDYLFTLQNVINKRFDLEEGGTITWTGSPYDADINITAVYRLRARLYDLLANIDTNDIYKKRIPVDLKLNMRNAMVSPDISFDISLPTADEDTKGKVRSVLYVSDKEANVQELNKQVFSLLVLNSFLPPPGSESSYGRASATKTTSSELLSNQLSNMLSKISNDFDLGFNYRPG